MSKTVVVAMSGGVDSSVAAALLKDEGYNVIGITLQVWPEDAGQDNQGCCSLDAVEDARRVASTLGIPHYVMNMRAEFERAVIRDFVEEYSRGRTPNPCVRCNERVKFRALLERSEALGAEYLATGHYARIVRDASGEYKLLRSLNSEKDQSYVLYMLGQRELARILFPVESLTKDEARAIARDKGLCVWSKPESQEICFVGKSGYKEYISSRNPELAREGAIVDLEGREIGRHKGASGFTIGQRRGIGLAAGEPLYVIKISAAQNTVVVGPDHALYSPSVTVEDVRWVSGTMPQYEIALTCKVRYNMPIVGAKLKPCDNDLWELEFDVPQRAPAPGQAAVFYDGDRVLGGGTISEVQGLGKSRT